MSLVNDIEILRKMFHPAALVALRPGQGKPAVELTDAKADTTVEIKGLPHESVVIRAEDFKVPRTVFNSINGQRKRADFVIVANEDAKRWIIYIETQAGNYKTAAHIIQQLQGAQCFIGYCKCIGKSFWESEEFLDGYESRFVSIAGLELEKQGTRSYSPHIQSKGKLHDTPDAFLKILGSPNLYFRHLTQVPG